MAPETTDLDYVLQSGCVRRGIRLAGRVVRLLAGRGQHRRSSDPQVARIGHRATWDVRRTRGEQALRGGTTIPTSHGSKTSEAERLPEARQDVTMLVIPRGPEHQALTYVYSGSAGPFQVRLLRQACLAQARDVSALCTIKRGEVVAHPALRREAESMRCETDQAKGRHPYLVTRAAVLGVGEGVPPAATFHAQNVAR